MAESLIKGMTKKWEPEKYSDDYHNELLKVIEEKIKSGGKKSSLRKTKPAKASNVVDLVAILQQSLDQTKGSGGAKKVKNSGRKQRKAA